MRRHATGLTRCQSARSVSFSATAACATSLTTTAWTMTPSAPAARPSTMPAIAVMATDPASTASNSSVPGCSVSRRVNDAIATPPTPRMHDEVGGGLHAQREAEQHAGVLPQGGERPAEDRAERERPQRDDSRARCRRPGRIGGHGCPSSCCRRPPELAEPRRAASGIVRSTAPDRRLADACPRASPYRVTPHDAGAARRAGAQATLGARTGVVYYSERAHGDGARTRSAPAGRKGRNARDDITHPGGRR